MLEGAILFQVAAVRRLDGAGLPQAAAPFAVRGQAGGYASACAADESARGEQWMPLWSGPASLVEVRGLFAEGRLQSGAGRAHKALDAARAVARVGVARGVSEFVRFGYIERNGQANLAVPLGRWPVQITPDARTHLLDEIDPWVETLRRASRSNTAPASVGRTLRVLEGAMLAACRGSTAERWQRVLLALADAEDLLTARPKGTAEARLQPIPRLSPEWLDAADDDSPEVRIARAIASQTGPFDRRTAMLFGPVRAHCLPLDPASGFTRFATGADSLLRDPRVVWTGRDLVSDLGQIALRRVIEHQRFGSAAFPLHGRAFPHLDDVALFLDGALDDARIAGLARAFMAVDWSIARAPAAPPWPRRPSAIHAVFRLAYSPERVDAYEPRCDPAPIRLLLAGQIEPAAKAALGRLGTRGVRSKIKHVVGSPSLAARLAASLAIPVAPFDLRRLLQLVDKPRRLLADVEQHAPSLPAADPPSEPALQE
jgi:CRISPR-associated protein Csx17